MTNCNNSSKVKICKEFSRRKTTKDLERKIKANNLSKERKMTKNLAKEIIFFFFYECCNCLSTKRFLLNTKISNLYSVHGQNTNNKNNRDKWVIIVRKYDDLEAKPWRPKSSCQLLIWHRQLRAINGCQLSISLFIQIYDPAPTIKCHIPYGGRLSFGDQFNYFFFIFFLSF